MVEEDQVRECLSKLDIQKFMGPEGIYPRVLREMVGVIVRPVFIIFDQSWRLAEMHEGWRKANIPIFKKDKKKVQGNYRPVSFNLVLGKVLEQLILGTISKHL